MSMAANLRMVVLSTGLWVNWAVVKGGEWRRKVIWKVRVPASTIKSNMLNSLGIGRFILWVFVV